MFEHINKPLKKLKTSEKGQSMIEYFIIIAFVAAIVMVSFNNGLKDVLVNAFKPGENVLSDAINDIFSDVNEKPAEEPTEDPPAEDPPAEEPTE